MAKTEARTKSRRVRAAPQRSFGAWWGAALLVLLLANVGTGLAVVEDARVTRTLYQSLGETQRTQDRLLERHSRLSLELGALSSLQKVEEVAALELNMHFPQQLTEIAP